MKINTTAANIALRRAGEPRLGRQSQSGGGARELVASMSQRR